MCSSPPKKLIPFYSIFWSFPHIAPTTERPLSQCCPLLVLYVSPLIDCEADISISPESGTGCINVNPAHITLKLRAVWKLVWAATELNTGMPMSARWQLELSRSCDDWEVQRSPCWNVRQEACMAFYSKDKHMLLKTNEGFALEAYWKIRSWQI